MGIILSSIQSKKILEYFLCDDYINQIIINISSSIEEQDIDFISYYINFLKSISNKLDIKILSKLFNKEKNKFILLDEANFFFNFNDVMIKNTSRNIFLSIIKLNYEPIIEYICDIPRITDFLLLNDKIKNYIINMISNSDINNDIKEIEENFVDDILFIQDILSIGISKINYILINCLFSIPLQYLFNCILKHEKINIVFYILNLIIKNIKNECINNLIAFILYSSKFNEKINEYIKYQENLEIYNIIYLNKYLSYISHINSDFNLLFEEYLILVYNRNFLKSIRYIKKDEKNFEEIKEIADYIKKRNIDINKDINICIKFFSEKLKQNEKLTNTITKMEKYHNLISRYTGINLGISLNESDFSFLKIIYDNFLYLYNNKNNFNIDIQENILKKECANLIVYNENNQSELITQIFLILQIINSNKISNELKKYLSLNNYLNNNKELINNSEEINNNSIFENKIIFRNLRKKNDINNNIDSGSLLSDKTRNEIIKDFFGTSEEKTENDFLNNYFNNNLYEENNLNNNNISVILIPKPINNDIIDDDIINYKNFNFKIKNINKLFNKFNTQSNEIKKENNDLLLEKIINIIFNNDNKILSKLIYRISFELIEHLILGKENNNINNKSNSIFMNKYKQILNKINNILLNSNSIKTKIYKFAYQYFEESFLLNKKQFNHVLDECIDKYFSFFLLNKNRKNDFSIFEIIDIPNKEHENLQCLFQILIGIYDLIKLFEKKNLLKNSEFPLNLINMKYDIGKIINLNELLKIKIDPLPVTLNFKNSENKNLFIFNYHNYLFFIEEINKSFIIRYKYPLRQIITYCDRGEPRILHLINKNEIEAELLFDDVQKANKMKDNINNAIKYTNLKEFSEVKKFIHDLMDKEKKIE